MKRLSNLIVTVLGCMTAVSAQTIPKEVWGRWTVRRELPATTISCWGEAEARKLIGTELEYSADLFRWQDLVTKRPVAERRIVSAEQFHAENSGMGTSSSQVTFAQLGIHGKQVTSVSIQHPEGNVSATTTEIPGDNILIRDRDTLVFSVCNVYFEARRIVSTSRPKPSF
jgi:hypothetical protein